MNQLNTQILNLARKNRARLDCQKSGFSPKPSRISSPISASALFCQMNFVRRRIAGVDGKVAVIHPLTRRNREYGKKQKSADDNRAAHKVFVLLINNKVRKTSVRNISVLQGVLGAI